MRKAKIEKVLRLRAQCHTVAEIADRAGAVRLEGEALRVNAEGCIVEIGRAHV